MIVKFFRHGTAQKGKTGSTGGGGAVRDYLLKDPNDKTKDRKGATLIRGNADQTTEVINNINRKARYKSGVLSFAKGETVSDKQKQEIIDSFENTLFVGLDKDQYSGYWVEHQDKDRLELHFVFAETELKTGKSLAIYYHKVDKSLVDTWKDLTNDKYNLLDPNDPMTKKAITPNTLKTRNDKDNALKDEISERILIAIEKDPNVKTRDDVVKLIESLDYKVNRSNQFDSISIRHPDEKDDKKKRPLRLKGDIFSKDFSRDCLPSQREKQKIQYDKDHDNRIAQTQSDYQKYLALREKRTLKRIGTVDRTAHNQELSAELDQIRAKHKPEFLKQVAEYQRQELKKIIGQTIEQIYRQHEHDQPQQLTSLKELHQTLIDSIDSQIKDEPLPQFDQVIADYQNSKNHVVTVDTIEHDRRQAELAEQAQLARLAQLEQQRQDRLALLASFDNFTLDETGIDELESMDYQALLDLKTEYEEWLQSVDDYAQHSDIEPYLNNYQYYRATLNYLHDSNLIEQKRIESERPIDPLITQRNELDELKHGYVSKISLYTYQTASNAVLEKIKQDMLDRIKLLDNRAEHELLTDKEKSSYGNAHRVINTIDDILSKREPEPVIEPEIVRSDENKAQLTPDHDPEPQPTAVEQLEQPQPQTPSHDPEREQMLLKAKISLQTIKNVIDTMPDNHPNRAKALDSYNQRLQSFERMSDDELRQVTANMPDIVVNKAPTVDIKAPSQNTPDQVR